MEQMASGISLMMRRKDSLLVIIFSTFCLFLLLLVVQNGNSTLSILSFGSLPLLQRVSLGLKSFFDLEDIFTSGTLLLAILGSLLGGVNMALAYTYMRLRGEVLMRAELDSGLGLFLAIIGVGCASCGTALLSIILSFFGFSAMLSWLPYQGQEIGYIGLIILLLATYYLAKRVAAPNVC